MPTGELMLIEPGTFQMPHDVHQPLRPLRMAAGLMRLERMGRNTANVMVVPVLQSAQANRSLTPIQLRR